MSRGAYSLGELLKQSDSTTALLSRAREQCILRDRVAAELEPDLRTHLIAALDKEQVLVLYVDSSAWASRIRFVTRILRAKLTKAGMCFDKIKVRVQLQSLPQQAPNKTPKRGLSNANAAVIRQLADCIDDQSLGGALRRLASHGQ